MPNIEVPAQLYEIPGVDGCANVRLIRYTLGSVERVDVEDDFNGEFRLWTSIQKPPPHVSFNWSSGGWTVYARLMEGLTSTPITYVLR